MNRLFAVAPVALLSTACAVRTPATALDAGGDVSLVTHDTLLPTNVEAIGTWALPPSSIWSRYEKLTLLTYLADTKVTATMPDVRTLDVVGRARMAATRLAAVGLPPDTMWVVDLRGAASVVFGSVLSHLASHPVAPVLTFNNWPADNEVVPAEQTLAALVALHPRPLSAGETQATPVFLLDAWRLAYREIEADPAAMDNRYVLLSSDFPDPATLLARGIRRVAYVVEDSNQSSTEEDDFHEVALAYKRAGIAMALVDLEQLARLEAFPTDRSDERWAGILEGWAFDVRVRPTIFDNPLFYAQARGGFGGLGAAPAGRPYVAAHPTAGAVAMGEHGGEHGRAYSGASPHVSSPGGG